MNCQNVLRVAAGYVKFAAIMNSFYLGNWGVSVRFHISKNRNFEATF